MKTKLFLSMALALAFIATLSIALAQNKSADTMKTRWNKVEEFARLGRPESAMKEVEAILAQAEKEKNAAETIKALVYKMRFVMEKNPDETENLIGELEAKANTMGGSDEKALLHSMAAELYGKYYEEKKYIIDQRTDIEGNQPTDMKTWTRSMFYKKIIEYANASLTDSNTLQQTPTTKYAILVELGKDSRQLQPTLFHFLAYRKIEMLKEIEQNSNNEYMSSDESNKNENNLNNEILKTFNQTTAFDSKQKNLPALVYTELQKLNYTNPSKDEQYLSALNALEKAYTGNEAVVEVLAEKAEYYLTRANEQEKADDAKKTAYRIVVDGISAYPNYKRIALLENLKSQILKVEISANYSEAVKPGTKLKLQLNTNNITELQLSIYKVEASAVEYFNYKTNQRREKSLYPKRTEVEKRTIQIKPDSNFNTVKSEIEINTGSYGIYEFLISTNKSKIRNERATGSFTVTDFAFIQKSSSDIKTQLYVLDRMSGNPQKDVLVKTYEQKWTGSGYKTTPLGEFKSNNDGNVSYQKNSNYENRIVVFERGNDRYFTASANSYGYYQHYNANDKLSSDETALFTDRSLYRPGQALYFKGIVYNRQKQQASPNATATIELYNVNGEKITEKKVKSNDFGSFEGTFMLPESGLNGAYRLQCGNNSINIWVEEYKRPTFEVTLARPKDEVRFGEKLSMKGEVKAYSGYAVADATVKYRVLRQTHRFCWWIREQEKTVGSGTTKTNADGNFDITFTPERTKQPTTAWWRGNEQYYTYRVVTDVTDSKGETQSDEQNVSVGDKALFIIAEIPNKLEKTTATALDISTQTLNGETPISTLDFVLSELKPSEEYFENISDTNQLQPQRIAQQGSFKTDEKLKLDLSKLTSGLYRLTLTTRDNRGNLVKEEKQFIIYSNTDKKPAARMYKWILAPKTELVVGERAEIKFGTSTHNCDVLYEIMQGERVLERRWARLNNEIKTFEIPFNESFGAGVTVMFTFMKDEKLYTEQVILRKKQEEKKLTPIVSVFRDKLKPGEKAEYTINIPQSTGDKNRAEMLVAMYDASLDALRPHSWSFNPAIIEQIEYTSGWTLTKGESGSIFIWNDPDVRNVPAYLLDELNWFGLPLGYQNYRIMAYGRAGGLKRMAKQSNDIMLESASPLEEKVMTAVASNMASMEDNAQKEKENSQRETVKVRENFNETAFFYPQLHTDKEGNVKFSFTAPESLTRWNLKMLAHSANLYFGQETMQVLTQKELMIQMNLPRFVRKSDKLTLAATVINLTETPQSAKLFLEINDPENEQLIQRFESAEKILLEAKASKTATWNLDALQKYDLVKIKVVAQNENFSDGEQKYLPVLPDKALITESQTLTIRANQKRVFNFTNFVKNMKNVDTKNFTVEFSSNPTWYAIQALPSLAEPTKANAVDLLAAYYANSLAAHIANSNPKLKSVFEQWKNNTGSRDALLSNLQKNQELKNILLEETPWLTDAKTESEQKKRIALLFALNQQASQTHTLDKLIELQLPSGGFTWFKGMKESRYITQEIALNMARLHKMTQTARSEKENQVIRKALKYLDMEIARDFAELKKWNKDYHKSQVITDLQLFYLHTRSEYKDIPVDANARVAVDFYTAQSEKYWMDWTLYGKAMMAVVAHRNGKSIVANNIIKSIEENALQNDELGMYWAKNRPGWWWNERPIATQTAIMEAMAEIKLNQSMLDEMKIWLLKQKQTQKWDSPIATVNAIYALLNYGNDWTTTEGETIINLGRETLKPESKEAGTGYFKMSVPTSELKPEMGNITVQTKGTATIGWGAAYWQYFQDIDQVKQVGKEIRISKKLFVERAESAKKTMVPIEQTKLKKGDKLITRLVLTTDRDMEFVALKDLRAACLEPVEQNSGYQWRESVAYYYSIKDASTQYFFDYLPKGTYVFEHASWVNNTGSFTSGFTSTQCLYAPEFTAHTAGEKITVE